MNPTRNFIIVSLDPTRCGVENGMPNLNVYTPALFAENRVEVLDRFIREHPFGILISNGPEAPHATHIPMYLVRENGVAAVLRCHLARANPHWRTFESSPSVLAIFSGAHHYITPSWYPSKEEHGRVVPTWNYVTVHAAGKARLFEGDELVEHVAELTHRQEARFENPWSIDDAPAEYVNTLAKAIVGVEISIERLEGKWKLSQNRPPADQAAVIQGLETIASPASLEVAELMKAVRPQSK
jgi:transcriptional regulator